MVIFLIFLFLVPRILEKFTTDDRQIPILFFKLIIKKHRLTSIVHKSMKHKIYKHKDDGIIRSSDFTCTYTQDVMLIATETAACCLYVNALVIFNGGCYWLLFLTTKSLFEFWLHQAYHAVSEMTTLVLLAVSNVRFFTLILLYINRD